MFDIVNREESFEKKNDEDEKEPYKKVVVKKSDQKTGKVTYTEKTVTRQEFNNVVKFLSREEKKYGCSSSSLGTYEDGTVVLDSVQTNQSHRIFSETYAMKIQKNALDIAIINEERRQSQQQQRHTVGINNVEQTEINSSGITLLDNVQIAIMQDDIEDITNIRYGNAIDYYELYKDTSLVSRTLEQQKIDDTNETRADVGKNLDMENNQGDAPIQMLDQEEPSPTFEAKTGFEKLIDKMSGSKNPLAQKLAQRLIAFKNRDKARLNSADTEKTQETFTEQSNKVRFGVGDSSLMPLGAGLRNSFIRAGESLMQLFQGKPKEPTPAKTMIPTTPKSFSEAVTVSDDVKKNTVVVGKQAGQNQNKIVEGKDKPQVSQGRVEDGDARSELE